MRTIIKFIVITVLFSSMPDDIQAQLTDGIYTDGASASSGTLTGFQDSIQRSAPITRGSDVIHGGIGFGYMMKGGYFSLKVKYVSQFSWGSSLDLKFCSWKTKNLPSDYSPLFYPRDECLVVSLNLVRVLTRSGQNPRFSAEVGPSLVRIENEIITPNPDYDPNSIWHLSKYFRSDEVKQTLGLSMSLGTEIIVAPIMILDFSVFANINSVASFLGIGLYFGFGDVKD
jgi:hypothetical protein